MNSLANNIVLLVPARLLSTRYPRKPLAPILGRPMIEHVCERLLKLPYPFFIVTDDATIEQVVVKAGGKVLRVDDDVATGSDRLSLAYHRHIKTDPRFKNLQLIVNVQGDEPTLDGQTLIELIEAHLQSLTSTSPWDMGTLVKKEAWSEDELLSSPQIVKVAYSEKTQRCLYFSRSAIPFLRPGMVTEAEAYFHRHIGVYSYSRDFFEHWPHLTSTRLEQYESLEQLRALESGYSIGAIQTTRPGWIGVDVPEDIIKVEKFLDPGQE